MSLQTVSLHTHFICDWSMAGVHDPASAQPVQRSAGVGCATRGDFMALHAAAEADEIWSLRIGELHARLQVAEVFGAD